MTQSLSPAKIFIPFATVVRLDRSKQQTTWSQNLSLFFRLNTDFWSSAEQKQMAPKAHSYFKDVAYLANDSQFSMVKASKYRKIFSHQFPAFNTVLMLLLGCC